MNATIPKDLPLLSLPMGAVLLAQFFSAFGDNALLITAIALVKADGHAGWIPLLQAFFVIPFILLAPFVGALADAFPKGRVMLFANGLKLVSATAMAAGMPPLLCYGMAGVGAAAYSPAKYGILSQLFGADKLVKANGMLEGSTIVAILLGVLVGGWLADQSLAWAFTGVIGVYALAALINLLIPRLPPEHPFTAPPPQAGEGRGQPETWLTILVSLVGWLVVLSERGLFIASGLLRQFLDSLHTLWQNTDTRFSLLGTSLFWGTGSTLRLLLFTWVPVALGIASNQMPANLMGVVSVGIVIGAALAGLLIKLENVNRALIGGLLLGPLVLLFAQQTSLLSAALLLASIGAAGGLFVVPLNALLQERGHRSVGAGHALAVQNLWENLVMLGFVGAYALLEDAPVVTVAMGFGGIVFVGMLALAWGRRTRTATHA
jgi:LPLT family lysophospholipid transporter-like MFS transporter